MDAMMIWKTRDRRHDLVVDSERRPVMVRLYLARLARLLQLTVTELPGLTTSEQQQLMTHAAYATVRVLSELDSGAVASDMLRRAGRRL